MKRILLKLAILAISITMILSFSACGNNNNNENSETTQTKTVLSQAKKEAYYEGTINGNEETQSSSYYGVGRTLNVLEDEYITVGAGYSKIFNPEKLLALKWYSTNVNKMQAEFFSGQSIKEYAQSFNDKIALSLGGQVDFLIFNAGVEEKFDFSSSLNYVDTANELFYTMSQIYCGTLIEIDEYFDLSQFADIMSETVLQDAQAVQDGSLSAKNFIYKYGTHAVLAGYYGGKVDCSYYLRNLAKKWSDSLEANLEASVNAGIDKLFKANQSIEFSVGAEQNLTETEIEERFMASSIGGKNFAAAKSEDFWDGYREWSESMNDGDYGNLVDLPKRSLVAIWDLLPDKYSNAKTILKEYFDQTAESVSSEFLAKFERKYTEPEDNGDTTNFDGGHGTKNDPYLITSSKHFANIEEINKENPEAYFILGSYIDLGIWNSPFKFTGNLNGFGYEITYTQTIPGKEDGCYGLFDSLDGAAISNLKINAKIGDTSGSGSVNVGILAGQANNKNSLSKIYVSGSIVLKNGEGKDYAGGIIGRFNGGDIDQCKSDATVETHSFYAITGGIVGYATPENTDVTISNCYNTGAVKAYTAYIWGGRSAGGIIGQVKGHSPFTLKIQNCYNDSEVNIIQEQNAALGWWGCCGLYGDIDNNKSEDIIIQNSYWNKSKTPNLSGNSVSAQSNYGKENLNGTIADWSQDIWKFYEDSAPELLWLI